MPKTAKTKPATVPPTGALDLQRLTQAQAAWLIGRPTSWLRDRADLLLRNPDGTYNARDLVRAFGSDVPPADLDDESLEGVLNLADTFVGGHEDTKRGIVRILTGIQARYGAAGMAAVATEFLDETKRWLAEFGESPYARKPTEKEIRAEAAARAEQQIAELPEWNARLELRTLGKCEVCGLYRWGRQWLKPPAPAGHIIGGSTRCPACLEK